MPINFFYSKMSKRLHSIGFRDKVPLSRSRIMSSSSHDPTGSTTAAQAAPTPDSPTTYSDKVKSQTLEQRSRSTGVSQTGASHQHAGLGESHNGGESKSSDPPTCAVQNRAGYGLYFYDPSSKILIPLGDAPRVSQGGRVFEPKRKISGDHRKGCVSTTKKGLTTGLYMVKLDQLKTNGNKRTNRKASMYVKPEFVMDFFTDPGESYPDSVDRSLHVNRTRSVPSLWGMLNKAVKNQPKIQIARGINSSSNVHERTLGDWIFKAMGEQELKVPTSSEASSQITINGGYRPGQPHLSAIAVSIDGPRHSFMNWLEKMVKTEAFYPCVRAYALRKGANLPEHWKGRTVKNLKFNRERPPEDLQEFCAYFEYPEKTIQMMLNLDFRAMDLSKFWKQNQNELSGKLPEFRKFQELPSEIVLTTRELEDYRRFMREMDLSEFLMDPHVRVLLRDHLDEIKGAMSKMGCKFSIHLRDRIPESSRRKFYSKNGNIFYTSSDVTWEEVVDVFEQVTLQIPRGGITRDQYVDNLILKFVTSRGAMKFNDQVNVVTKVKTGSYGDMYLTIVLNNWEWFRRNVPDFFTNLQSFFERLPRNNHRSCEVGGWDKCNISWMIIGESMKDLNTLDRNENSLYSAVAKWLQEPGRRPNNLFTATLRTGLKYRLSKQQDEAGRKIARWWRIRHFYKAREVVWRDISFVRDVRKMFTEKIREVEEIIGDIKSSERSFWEGFYDPSDTNISYKPDPSWEEPINKAMGQLEIVKSWAMRAFKWGFITETDKEDLDQALKTVHVPSGTICSESESQGIAQLQTYMEMYSNRLLKVLDMERDDLYNELDIHNGRFLRLEGVLSAPPGEYEDHLEGYAEMFPKPTMVDQYWHMVDHGRKMRTELIDPRCMFFPYSKEEEKFAEELLSEYDEYRSTHPGKYPHDRVRDLLPPKVVERFWSKWQKEDDIAQRLEMKVNEEDVTEQRPSSTWSDCVARNANDPELLEAEKERAKKVKLQRRKYLAQKLTQERNSRNLMRISCEIASLCEDFGLDHRDHREIDAVRELVSIGWNGRVAEQTPSQVLDSLEC